MADKITIELEECERELLLKFSNQLFYQDIVEKITEAPKKGDYYSLSLKRFEVEDLVGNLSFIINHSDDEDPDVIDELNDLTDSFESYI